MVLGFVPCESKIHGHGVYGLRGRDMVLGFVP